MTVRSAATGPELPPPVPFDWSTLSTFKADGRFLDHYPEDWRTFWSPRDDVRGLLRSLLTSAQHSIVVNMFGYDDAELDAIIRSKLDSKHVYVQISLDKSQSKSSKTEKDILAQWKNTDYGNSIAIGTSAVKSAISHLKIVIVDGIYTVRGSTNWSVSGETEQDNELTLSRNAVIAAETRAELDMNHDWMLKQMAAKRASTAARAATPATKKKATKKRVTKRKAASRRARA